MKPFFSVVIPLYNKENHIYNTIKSVLNQSFKDFEIIIVNDGSTDKSIDVISTIVDNRIEIIDKKNEGASKARNIGIQNAKSDYVALLDADDIWYPNHLQNLKHLIECFPGCGLYCSGYEISYYNKKIVGFKFYGIVDTYEEIVSDYFTSSRPGSIASSSSVAISKKIIQRHGYFDTDIKSGQDTEFWIRIALHEKVAFKSEISVRIIISEYGNHLSLSNKRIDKLKILERFKKSEVTNKSLKGYLDVIRFALAMDRKMSGDILNFVKIVKDIDLTNLNVKQQLILKLPGFAIRLLKRFQLFLIKHNIYLTPFK